METPVPLVRRKEPAASSNVAAKDTTAWSGDEDSMAGLVAGCQRGDANARRQLYEVCRHKVCRLVVRMVNAQDAPDLTQQVFLQLFRTIGQFGGHAGR